jgi:DNA-binding SARP family transcriptional activator/tetratricopeptide (TPR) repeat protein
MQLSLFGGFALRDRSGAAIQVPQKRGQALLAYLAWKNGHRESREVLVDLLWPDRFKKQAMASLRQILFELRNLPGDGEIIEATNDEVALNPSLHSCDIWTFSECLASGHLADALQAMTLYKGSFLDGPGIGPEPFQQWVAIQRARFEGQLDRVVLLVSADWEAAKSTAPILALLEELLHVSPMCVPAMLRIMDIEAHKGDTASAIQKCQRYVRRLKIEFGEDAPVELLAALDVLNSAPKARTNFQMIQRRPTLAQSDPWRKTTIDAPVVAVLPFRHLGSGDTGAAVAAAIGEDVTMMLSGCRWFNVLSRSATHSFASGSHFIPKEFANHTGADYLVYGAVIERAANWSITIELADAESGIITWARRYDTSADGLMQSPQELCPLIAAALDPAIAESEQRALSRPTLAATGSVAAYKHLVIGYRHYYAGRWREARESFRAATEEDATYAHAYAMMALTAYYVAQVGRNSNWRDEMQTAEKLARRAIEIDPSEAKACIVLGQALDWQAQHDEAGQYLERALHANPSFATASTARAYHLVMTGAFQQAQHHMRSALRLRVGDAGLGLCLPAKALADLHNGNAQSALETIHWASRLRPDFWLVRQVLAAALHAAGNAKAAEEEVVQMRRDYSGLSGKEFAGWFPYGHASIQSPVAATFRHFGWK